MRSAILVLRKPNQKTECKTIVNEFCCRNLIEWRVDKNGVGIY